MRKQEDWRQLEQGLMLGLTEGAVTVPYLLLKYYNKLRISETEAMLLIHIMAFRFAEQKEFPTLEEIQSRMFASPDKVIQALQRLIKEHVIDIDEHLDPVTDIQSEHYNFKPLYRLLAACCIEELRQDQAVPAAATEGKDLFTIFEQEFGRPLSPMECESISKWLDKDDIPEPLILMALKEAVFAGKIHFRYIDRILLEWSKNRIRTIEQAKEYVQKFRGGARG